MDGTENKNQENLPVVVQSEIVGDSIFTDTIRFELAQRVAKALASSSIVPDDFKGNIGNCLIAQNMAGRMDLDVFMLMQNIHIIHGKPGIAGKLAIALVNKSGLFQTQLKFEFGDDRKSCRAMAIRNDGAECEGTWVTWDMVVAEGWDKNKKWHSMPELMFQYRAAAFFARIHCPEVILGMQTSDELEDVAGGSPIPVHGVSETKPGTDAKKPNYDVTEKGKVFDELTKEPPPKTEQEKPPVFDGHKSGEDGPPDNLNMDGSEKEDPEQEPAKGIEAEEFHRKHQSAIQSLIDAPGRIDATADHILRMLWTKCEQNKWDITHPKYLAWKDDKSLSEKQSKGPWTGAPTDKIGDDPERTALKRLHATIKEKGLEPGGVQPIMFAKYDIKSSKDIEIRNIESVINWLDDIIPAKNLIYQLNDAQRVMADKGRKIDLVALAMSKLKEAYPEQCGGLEHLYQLYNKPASLMEWVLDNMDSWISEDKPPEQKPIIDTQADVPKLTNLYDVVCYAADLTGKPKDNPMSPEFSELAAKVQEFTMAGFNVSEKDLAAGLPDGIGEKFREHFAKWYKNS